MASGTKPTAALPRMRCHKCDKTFDDKHELAVHQLKEGHLVCDICGESFHNIESVSAHRTRVGLFTCSTTLPYRTMAYRKPVQIHRSHDSVACPGCPKTFVTAGRWMHHVEKGECPSLFPSDVSGSAAEVMAQLSKEWRDYANVEYTPFSGDSHIRDTWAGYKDEADTPRFEVQKHPVDFPGIANQASHRSSSTGDGAGQLKPHPGNAWSQKKNLFPEKQERKAAPLTMSSLTEDLVESILSGRPSSGPILDPGSPGFNVAVFYNPILEVYACPHKMCK